jgi:hypothetical protein
VENGMEEGHLESYDRMEEVLAELAR